MIAVDTNVLLRYIVRDDAAQTALATRLIEDECSTDSPAFVCLAVLVEIVWVAETSYGMERDAMSRVLRQILDSDRLHVEQAEAAWRAVRLYESSRVDFADCLILGIAASAGCDATMTFDKTAAKAGMTLLK